MKSGLTDFLIGKPRAVGVRGAGGTLTIFASMIVYLVIS